MFGIALWFARDRRSYRLQFYTSDKQTNALQRKISGYLYAEADVCTKDKSFRAIERPFINKLGIAIGNDSTNLITNLSLLSLSLPIAYPSSVRAEGIVTSCTLCPSY